MTPDENSLPSELVARDQWTNWSPEVLSFTKRAKQPYFGPTRELSYTSPEGSGSFTDALGHTIRHDNRGIGYVFLEDDPHLPIDLDGCLKGNGDLKEWCPKPPWLTPDDWAEVSSSGIGLHTVVKGVSLPWWWSDQQFEDREHTGVECDGGNSFFALTGDLWRDHGTHIPHVDQETFETWLKDVCRAVSGETPWENEPPQRFTEPSKTDVELGIYDVLSRSVPRGKKVEHPYHGSNSGINFQVDTDEPTWRCWRHDVTGNAHHLLGMEAGVFECGDWVTRRITPDEWTEAYDYGRAKGYNGIRGKKTMSAEEYNEYMRQRAEEYDREMTEYYQAQYESIEDELPEVEETRPEPQNQAVRADGGQSEALPEPKHQGLRSIKGATESGTPPMMAMSGRNGPPSKSSLTLPSVRRMATKFGGT